MKKKSQVCIKCLFYHAYTFCRFGFAAYRHGRRWFHAIATFWQAKPTKTRVQKLTRTSILGHSHTKAKTAAPADRTVAVPQAYTADARVIVPAAAAKNTVSPRRSTLRIGNIFCCYGAIPIKTPFPDISRHII